jgi:3-mercaptopyruvate sulfurtransferase SseA
MLRAAGFEDVVTVPSGLPAWEAHGFPVEYGPEAGSIDWLAATATADEAHTH